MTVYISSDDLHTPEMEFKVHSATISKDSPDGLAKYAILAIDTTDTPAEHINMLSNIINSGKPASINNSRSTSTDIDIVYVDKSTATTHTIASVGTSGKAVISLYTESETKIPNIIVIKYLFD